MLAPTMAPSLAVVAAATLVIAFWAAAGLVNPGMVNVIAWPPVNVPVVNETVKTYGPVPDSAAVPAAPAAGAVNVRAAVPEFARARPAPVTVMTILPVLATNVTGVSVTLMVTDAAPFATLLRVMAGCDVPREGRSIGLVVAML